MLSSELRREVCVYDYRVMRLHVEYKVHVQLNTATAVSAAHNVWRRYQQFLCLHELLECQGVNIEVPFPPKDYLSRLWGRWCCPRRLQTRAHSLQRWLQAVHEEPSARSSDAVMEFWALEQNEGGIGSVSTWFMCF
jgi:hypothetical protein